MDPGTEAVPGPNQCAASAHFRFVVVVTTHIARTGTLGQNACLRDTIEY